MDPEIDDYRVLGLLSGAKLSEKEISKAYKQKALILHPDKRPDDPNAHDNFQKLKNSYDELLRRVGREKQHRDRQFEAKRQRKDETELFGREKQHRHRDRQFEAKRQRMDSDLERREKGEFSASREEEEKIKRELQEEIACIRARHAKSKVGQTKQDEAKQGSGNGRSENVSGAVAAGVALDKTKILKVSWEKGIGDYSASRLRELFQEFGEVEDVVINSSSNNKKAGSALVVMASKEAAAAATGSLIGHLSNLLCVVPLQPATASNLNLGGLGHLAFENSVLDKLRKAAQKQSKLI